MRTTPTVRDVAAKAGVTSTVVSRVLHNKVPSIRVSEATAVRVREAAKELGYRVNVAAQNFRNRQTHLIGLHGENVGAPQLSEGSRYFATLAAGIITGAFELGYSVAFCPKLMGQTPEDAMSDGRFDGLIWYSTIPSEENAAMLRGCTAPLVVIHAQYDHIAGNFPNVACDNAQGVALALEHLVGLGHRRIAFAREGDLEFSESSVRRDAFVQWMSAHGLPVSDEDILVMGYDRSGVDEYLASGPPHTAIFAHNENLGAAFVQRAPVHGLRVPEDLSVVGFDSTAYCNEVRPTLTAVAQPLEAMGRRAVELLIEQIANVSATPVREVMPCGFDVRESTGPVRLREFVSG